MIKLNEKNLQILSVYVRHMELVYGKKQILI